MKRHRRLQRELAPAPSAYRDLEKVRAAEGGLYGSAGDLFSDAVFGRDSIVSAQDLLPLKPDIAREVIVRLAQLQGTVDAIPGPHSNEEEVGKIHHEHRSLYVGGRRISARSQELLESLSAMWGGDAESMTYYGSADATPLHVRLVGRYVAAHGPGLLDESLVNKDGRSITVRDSLVAATGWIARKLEESPLGLLEFRRTNPHGIPFQAWKDSGTSYLHRAGLIADYNQPIAAVEIQGYAYDALRAAAVLFPDEAERWLHLASELRTGVLRQMWMPDEGWFAMGIDRDPQGRPRQIESVASNGALLLGTTIFDGLADAQDYIAPVARRIYSQEFVTEVGVRCRSLTEDGWVDFQDYHGTWANWQKDGYEVAQGLQRQGFDRLAQQLYWRLLNGVNVAGATTEFLYVSPDQKVDYDFADRDPLSTHPIEIHGTNRPEPVQTWTVTAMLAIKSRRRDAPPVRAPWATALEDDLLLTLPVVQPLKTAAEREGAYARRGDFVLNPRIGFERDQAARSSPR